MKSNPYYGRLLVAVILLWTLVLGACSPAKRIMRNEGQFELIAQEVIRRGYCVNDTVVQTIIERDTIVLVENPDVYTQTVDLPMSSVDERVIADFDTLLESGHRVSYKQGRLEIKGPSQVKLRERIVIQHNYIRDKARERQLEDSLRTHRILLDQAVMQLDEERSINTKLEKRIDAVTWKLALLLMAIAVFVALRIIRSFRSTFGP